MEKKAKRQNIFLTTVPNGYVLKVDGQEYMAFDVENMLAQVFTHIALHERDYLEANFVKSLFEVALAYPDYKDAYNALADEKATVKDQQKTINRLYKRLNDMSLEKDELEKKYADSLLQVEKYANRTEDLARSLVRRDEVIKSLRKEIEEESIVIQPRKHKPSYKKAAEEIDAKISKRIIEKTRKKNNDKKSK